MQGSNEAGIATAIVANIAVNVALNLERYAKRRLARLALHGFRPFGAQTYIRWIGMGLLLLGESSNFIAYGLAPASIVSPIGVLAVISNCIIPPLLFDEPPSKFGIAGTAMALPGLFLLVLSSPEVKDTLTLPLEPAARNFLVSSLLITAAFAALGGGNLFNAAMRMRINSILSSFLGAYSILSIKALILLTGGHRDLNKTFPLGWLWLVAVVAGLGQVVILVRTLEENPVWQVVPHHFVSFTAAVALGSGLIFHEFDYSSDTSKFEFSLGFVLTIIGVWISAQSPPGDMGRASRGRRRQLLVKNRRPLKRHSQPRRRVKVTPRETPKRESNSESKPHLRPGPVTIPGSNKPRGHTEHTLPTSPLNPKSPLKGYRPGIPGGRRGPASSLPAEHMRYGAISTPSPVSSISTSVMSTYWETVYQSATETTPLFWPYDEDIVQSPSWRYKSIMQSRLQGP